MSLEFEKIRLEAVRIADREILRPISHLRESGMENFGVRNGDGRAIYEYQRVSNIGRHSLANDTAQDQADRMWCGMFIYYCYHTAARGRRLPFPPEALWGGRRLYLWSTIAGNRSFVVDPQAEIQPGDIFATVGNHIGMATGLSDAAHNFSTIEGNQSDLAHPLRPGIARRRMNTNGCRVIVRI